jgi:CRISPR/Cas system-associated exonuclease Cas4 (RecB family)
LNEDILPAKPAALPWAEASAFTAAFGGLPGFVAPDADDRAARWQHARSSLRRAARRARQRLFFSWSATDQDGRRRLPSPVLQAALADLASVTDAVPENVERLRPGAVDAMLICSPAGVEELQIPEPAIFTTSPSAIENFLQCPRQYFYARELGLYDVASSGRQAFGQVVHAALRDLMQAGETTPEISELIERHWPRRERRFGSRLREAAYRRLAMKAVAQVVAAEQEHAGMSTFFLAAEASFTWQIAPDVELRGTIDRIDRGPDGLIVLDYKLGTHSPSIKELLAKFAPPPADEEYVVWRPADLQLPLYALAVERGCLEVEGLSRDEPVAEMGLVYPLELYTPKGKLSDKGRRMIRIIDHAPGCAACGERPGRSQAAGVLCRRQLELIMERTIAAIAEMRSGKIDPDPRDGAQTCRSCAFRTICPAPQA